MEMYTQWIRYGNDRQYTGVLMKPARAAGLLPAVIVIQEIWGVDGHIEDVTRRFAEAGYVAFSPDLYAQGGERPASLAKDRVEAVKTFLDSLPPAGWHSEEARAEALSLLPEAERKGIEETFATLFGGLKMDLYTEQLLATSMYLRTECEYSKGKGAVAVGFCMGGSLSALLACLDSTLAGAAIFYGSAPSQELLARIACPVRGFYGGEDKRITDAVPAFAEAMQAAGKDFAYRSYAGAQHAFFNDTRRSYDVNAARDAFAQTLSFFSQLL